MLRKFNKPDPTSVKAYRPITLEETFGKVLEKIIATRLQYFANNGKLPPNQYGGRQKHSVDDAITSLIDEVETAWAQGKVVSALACDVSGFFPSVQHSIVNRELKRLGIPNNIVNWTASFLNERVVSLAFDGYTSQPTNVPNQGIPQGSPVSPILAAIAAAPALSCLDNTNVNLRAYVDDNLLTTSSNSLTDNIQALQNAYRTLSQYYHSMGLSLDDDKTELIHFEHV